MVSLSLVAIAGSAALLSLSQSQQTTDSSIRAQQALGMAQQLLDEQSTMLYMAPGDYPTNPSLGCNSAEAALPGRQFNDFDDFNGRVNTPACDRWGVTLGTDDGDGTTRDPAAQLAANALSRWRQQVNVYYTTDSAPNTPTGTGATYYRLSVVQIQYNDPTLGWTTLASLSRTVSYVTGP